MKKFLCSLCVLAFFLPPVAIADNVIDLSGMSYKELVSLKDQINLAIWNSQEWQEVTVPMGVWIVGEDIPAGHWTIKTDASYATILICDALNDSGKGGDVWKSDIYEFESIASPNGLFFDPVSDRTEIDFKLKKGMYVIIDGGNVIFSPYAGKPSLGFK